MSFPAWGAWIEKTSKQKDVINLKITDLTIRAAQIAAEAHAGQRDQLGMPYLCHPLAVAEQMEDELSTCVALLHDCMEDAGLSADYLTAQGMPSEVVAAVQVLSRAGDETYFQYIGRVKQNPVAKQVKIADLNHNLDPERVMKLGRPGLKERYEKALKILLGPDSAPCSRCRNQTLGRSCTELICGLGREEFETGGVGCREFSSRYMEFPLLVNTIDYKCNHFTSLHPVGVPVIVRPVNNNPDEKSYFGILLGDVPTDGAAFYNKSTHILSFHMNSNPGIFVPELCKIVYGYESWWRRIETEDDLKNAITDEAIQNVFYMRMLKDMLKGDSNAEP